MTKEIGTVSQKYRRIELALQKATPAKVKELVKEMIQETLPMFEEGRNPTILSMCVCIAKAMANIIYEEHHHAVIYLTKLNRDVVKKISYKKNYNVETLIKWAKNKVKKNKGYKVYVYKHRDLIYNN